ncbi:MAG: hypothetical protein N2593_03160 [Patescibacteria group bacterium]|nr:hypothetical protein [Patescibacteria group bacterium]
MDPRHKKRIKIVQQLYSEEFYPQQNLLLKTKNIIKNEKKIIDVIKKITLKFPIEKIAKIDMAILKLAIYEILIEKKQPKKVIINEAIELAKEFGGEKSYAFINAVLGKVIAEKNNI